ncbi:DUF1428 domain-containing protein [Thalassotalea atypica]|uniref:DUF1428 domain-containing protein n=1 Tax=Thalassotalea atypica TaxID=2054316 RepID=UPI0025748EBC|nr:DUF1428 family protein [Thalassotalea atypica]
MTHYIDGFTLPIPSKSLNNYKHLSQKIALIWKEYGALDYQEFVGDELTLAGTKSFTEIVEAKTNEVVIFGWVAFKNKDARDSINAKVALDPRMEELIAQASSGFDANRMVYAGFKPLF